MIKELIEQGVISIQDIEDYINEFGHTWGIQLVNHWD